LYGTEIDARLNTAPPTPGMVRVVQVRLIANPLASGVSEQVLDAVVARLTAVSRLELRRTERPGHAVELAAQPGADVVVAIGGDGTANEVANGIPPGVRLGVLPGGASSVFARQLGFSTRPVRAAGQLARALAAGNTRTVGLGRMDGRRFTFAASVGFDAEATRDVDRARRERPGNRRPGDLAVVAAGMRELASHRFRLPERMTVRPAAGPPLRASYLIVANQHPYTYFGRLPVRATPRASFDTGLDAVAVGELRPHDLWRLPLYALVWPRHASGRSSRLAYLHDVSALEVDCDQPMAVQLDGEYIDELSRVEIAFEPAAVEVFLALPDPARSRLTRRPQLSFRSKCTS
jgi:diacylglycerol kinase family enzyme